MTTKEAYELGIKLGAFSTLPKAMVKSLKDKFSKKVNTLLDQRVIPWMQKRVEAELEDMVKMLEKQTGKGTHKKIKW